MACHFNENVYTTVFTPREYQVELLDTSKESNTIVCLGNNNAKTFVALKLLQELAAEVRSCSRIKSVFILDAQNVQIMSSHIRNLTDLTVGQFENVDDTDTEFNSYQVLVMTSDICLLCIKCGRFMLEDVNLLVIDDCRLALNRNSLRQIFDEYSLLSVKKRPRVLGLTTTILSQNFDPSRLQAEFEHMEKILHSKVDTSSDIVTVLRYCSKPSEKLVLCANAVPCTLSEKLEMYIMEAKSFIEDHRYDPFEIYDDEFREELQEVPDPKVEPLAIFDEFLYVLHTMGPWCADRAAFALLCKIENLKVKIPYERHYLLLCMVSTVMVRIRAECDYEFQKFTTDHECIYAYSSPRVLRLLQVLRAFKPDTPKKSIESNTDATNQISENDVQPLNTEEAAANLDTKNPPDATNNTETEIDTSLNETSLKNDSCGTSNLTELLNQIDSELIETNCLEENSVPNSDSEINSEKCNNSNQITGSDCSVLESTTDLVKETNSTDITNMMGSMTSMFGQINVSAIFDEAFSDIPWNEPENNTSMEDTLAQLKEIREAIKSNLCKDFTVVPETTEQTNDSNHNSKESDDEISIENKSATNSITDTSDIVDIIITKGAKMFAEDMTNSKLISQSATGDDVIKLNGCDSSETPKNNINPVAQNIGMRPWKTRQTRQRKGPNRVRPNLDPDALCAIIFVERRFIAKILYYLISELVHSLEDFNFLSAQYTVEKIADPIIDNREAETEHRKQEEVLKKFRMHECNLLIATKVLEEGIDIPKCNLVIRFDQPQTYNSYVQCKGRAKMPEAHYVLLAEEENLPGFVKQLAEYSEIEKMLLSKCKNREPTEQEEREADLYTSSIQPYIPGNTGALVSVATAVALVNKYCAKLPSDTFTRLTPLWMMDSKDVDGTIMYECSIRLPINSPLKQTITGLPMPNRVLSRRIAALQVCRLLHQIGELDDNLLPVGKESFKAFEDDWNNFPLEESDELLTKNNLEPRPGTTKRRQYYYKRVADALTDCRPLPSESAYLYLITMTLTCPLPEEQNTRGRKIYPPEDSAQGFGILTLKEIPKICPFPIFTRSGEVRVGLELASPNVIMTQEQLGKIMEFLNYIFTNVLRLQKYLMLFDPNASENSYFIVPTITNESGITSVDWDFLNEIYEYRNLIPRIIPEEDRTDFSFNPEIYQDAVVMPWYRNQDQPQYFYVAEICNHLNPKSEFPGTDYKTFEEYYFKKYNIQIQNLEQPLLDVDHTSARLNFLTPRYVNRKGVALPTSSEETKKAKRENLEQKQILVPELCTVHPFPASLWRKAVCLPCILYRINALLLADQIRKQVAEELALGQIILPSDFEWSPLNFGWSLSDVLKKSKEKTAEKQTEQTPDHKPKEPLSIEEASEENPNETNKEEKNDNDDDDTKKEETAAETKDENDEDSEEPEDKDWMEIGTWSNEMATTVDVDGLNSLLPDNITMCYPRGGENSWNNKMSTIRYGSPTSWMQSATFDDYDSDDSCDSYSSDRESSDNSNKSGGLRIEFKGDNVAEAIDIESGCANRTLMLTAPDNVDFYDEINEDLEESVKMHEENFQKAVNENETHIMDCGMIIPADVDFKIEKKTEEPKIGDKKYESLIESSLNLPKVDFNLSDSQLKNGACDPVDDVNLIYQDDYEKNDFKFSFDYQPDLTNHPGPSPSVILQALTMSNANDGINLERLETIGDSFLKYAITNYLYSTYDNIHEGKLSHLRSKQVSNLNLYRLGRLKILGESMIATKFDPHDNWLPPCYYVPKELEQALIDARVPANHWNRADLPTVKDMSKDEICQMVREKGEKLNVLANKSSDIGCESEFKTIDVFNLENLPCFIPYNLITQHSIPDKSVADCVEALIGAYLIECGPRGALLFMAWLGIRVLPKTEVISETLPTERSTGSLPLQQTENGYKQVLYGELTPPRSPLLQHVPNPQGDLEKLLDGFSEFERSIQYHFNDRSYLLQAMTHASYSPNTVTDCYQRLEFLGDAVLDYLITRHLYEDPRLHSPGALTDLRSALVNNTIFASLAVRHGFHKYFRHLSPGLHDVVNRFVQIQEENGHSISEEYYLIAEDESEEIEDVEVPKALGDVFESVAGAIFLDSSMSLDAVWRVYYRMMHKEIEQFSTSFPKSPIRELLELEPETAKFGKPEKLADGRRVRVTVEVFGKGTFKGIGRNYRIAKCTAAKCALKQLKKRGLLIRKN